MILSIGCSHSLGPYTDTNFSINRDHDNPNNNTPFNDWPSTLHYRLKNKKYRHIALPGMGALNYYELIQVLDEQGYLKNVTKLIVQWTNEPRLCTTLNPNIIHEKIERSGYTVFEEHANEKFYMDILGGIPILNIAGPTSLVDHIVAGRITANKPNSETSLFILEMIDNLQTYYTFTHNNKNVFNLCRNEIKNICKNNNIEFYEFAWDYNASIDNELSNQNNFKSVKTITEKDFDIVKNYISNHNKNNRPYENSMGHYIEYGQVLANKGICEFMEKQGLFDV